LAEQQTVPEEFFDEIVVVFDDDLGQDVDRLDHLLLEDGWGEDALDDEFFEKG
jgi:hypothetical protein